MGNSMVLKNLSGRPAGYVLSLGDQVICRAQLDEPARLVIVILRENPKEFELEASGREQCFACHGIQMYGCYIFRGETLLYVSDASMQAEFEKYMLLSGRKENDIKENAIKAGNSQKMRNEEKQEREPRKEISHTFAQRRWPPPECWDAACYRNGCWQEE